MILTRVGAKWSQVEPSGSLASAFGARTCSCAFPASTSHGIARHRTTSQEAKSKSLYWALRGSSRFRGPRTHPQQHIPMQSSHTVACTCATEVPNVSECNLKYLQKMASSLTTSLSSRVLGDYLATLLDIGWGQNWAREDVFVHVENCCKYVFDHAWSCSFRIEMNYSTICRLLQR